MKLTKDLDPATHFKASCARAAAAFLAMGDCLARISLIPMAPDARAYVASAVAALDAQFDPGVVLDTLRELGELEAGVEKVASDGR